MPELVTIPLAIVEVVIEYSRPNMKLLVDRATVVDQLFEAFQPWGIKVDDVDVITTGKPSEQGVKFKITTRRTSFFFGPSHCKLVRDDADWGSADETIRILDAGWRILVEIGSVQAGVCKTSIALHLQPRKLPFLELLRPFAPAALISIDPGGPVKAIATVVKWENRRITLDGSGQLANALFVRMDRDFPATSSYEVIAAQLRADENQLFEIIGVKEDTP